MNLLRLCVLVLAAAVAGLAQVAEFSAHGGVSRIGNRDIGSISAGAGSRSDDVQLRDGFRIGFRMTINSYRFAGHEVGYAYNRTQLRDNTATPPQDFGTAIHQGFYNFLVYAMPEGSRVRPFAAGGVHFNSYQWPGYSVSSGGGSTKFGINYGAGVKAKLSPLFLIRLDLRQYRNGKPFDFPLQKGWLNQTEVSAGFGIAL